MISLFITTLACFGLAFAAGHAHISLAPRRWLAKRGFLGRWIVELVECPACLGFWLGLVAPQQIVPRLVFGFFICGTSFILGRLTGLIHDDSE